MTSIHSWEIWEHQEEELYRHVPVRSSMAAETIVTT
jgi:hypothetical protein